MFSVIETPELHFSKAAAIKLADTVKGWGYRAAVWHTTNREQTERGYAVAVHSNNGFEGYAHAL